MTTHNPPEETPDDRRSPPERDRTPDGDDAPDTPPTEPQPLPVKEPPDDPGARGPYVVA